ncbi:hypothetical protein PVOR_27085 [Paenibacillus vortex V453]|uniref:Uncharacterized protein n=1 Tax=Paenibacillus vortex V453 TaxID=715225 RepID=A0A2R9SNM0_9BACL|nr:hypothetical protein PVOR_27085 [Paenibacillus vortex V453]
MSLFIPTAAAVEAHEDKTGWNRASKDARPNPYSHV